MKHQLIAVFAAVLFLAGCNDPEITSEPVTTATQDTPYTYALSAKDDDDANEAKQEEAGDSKKDRKTLFRKFVDDDDDVYYENVETGEVVWDLPEYGEVVEV